MTYAEKDSIRHVIEDFESTGVVDEIIVINNNAQEGTSQEVASTSAREVIEVQQGYGFATRRGLREAEGDLIVLCEPDGTFDASDINKFLQFSDSFDVVFGSRTSKQLIWNGANMKGPLKWGNQAVAKLMMTLFHTTHLSDVGCTYRLLNRETVDRILPQLQIGGSQLGPEIMMRSVLSGARHVEIPVHYRRRIGMSSVTGDIRKAIVLGMQMVLLILKTRVTTFGKNERPRPIDHVRRHRPGRRVIDLTEAEAATEDSTDSAGKAS